MHKSLLQLWPQLLSSHIGCSEISFIAIFHPSTRCPRTFPPFSITCLSHPSRRLFPQLQLLLWAGCELHSAPRGWITTHTISQLVAVATSPVRGWQHQNVNLLLHQMQMFYLPRCMHRMEVNPQHCRCCVCVTAPSDGQFMYDRSQGLFTEASG